MWAHIVETIRATMRCHCEMFSLIRLPFRWPDVPMWCSIFHGHRPVPAYLSLYSDKWRVGILASIPARSWCHVWCAFVSKMLICPTHQRLIVAVLPKTEPNVSVNWKWCLVRCYWLGWYRAYTCVVCNCTKWTSGMWYMRLCSTVRVRVRVIVCSMQSHRKRCFARAAALLRNFHWPSNCVWCAFGKFVRHWLLDVKHVFDFSRCHLVGQFISMAWTSTHTHTQQPSTHWLKAKNSFWEMSMKLAPK